MKRDTIFYKLFRQSPTLLFELVPEIPSNAERYRFDSVAVKEPRFEIDGVLLPPEGKIAPVFFVEVQFQKDEKLYERIFAETALYFYRNCEKFSDWQVIVIYPSQSTEQSKLYPHRSLLGNGQAHRIFLDQIGSIRTQPIWVALMILTTVKANQAPAEARHIIERSTQEVDQAESRVIIEMVTTIISYKFKKLSTQEVEAMLDITFEETRVYQEVKEAAKKKGLEQGFERGIEQGIEQGRREEAANLINRMLTKRFGALSDSIQASVFKLSTKRLEALCEALLDFEDLSKLVQWLASVEEEWAVAA